MSAWKEWLSGSSALHGQRWDAMTVRMGLLVYLYLSISRDHTCQCTWAKAGNCCIPLPKHCNWCHVYFKSFGGSKRRKSRAHMSTRFSSNPNSFSTTITNAHMEVCMHCTVTVLPYLIKKKVTLAESSWTARDRGKVWCTYLHWEISLTAVSWFMGVAAVRERSRTPPSTLIRPAPSDGSGGTSAIWECNGKRKPSLLEERERERTPSASYLRFI